MDHDRRRPGERLDVADERGAVVEAVGLELRRLVPRLGPPVLHRLDQRALLPADVAPRAREHLNLDIASPAADFRPAHPQPPGALDLALHDRDLLAIFVADVDPTAPGAGHEGGEDHPLEDEVGMAREQFAVLEGSRLALVAIADDILLLPGRPPDVVPLLLCRHPRAPHAAQVGHLQLLDHPFARAAGHEGPHRLVVSRAVVGIDPPRLICDRHPVGVGGEVPPGENLADGPVDLRLIAGHEEGVVDRHGHRSIAAPQARRIADGDPTGRDLGRPAAFQARLQSRASLLMASHVVADAHLHARRGLEPEVGKEARHLLEPVERRAGPLRQAPQLLPGQVAVVMLDPVEFLDDHRRQTRGRGEGE